MLKKVEKQVEGIPVIGFLAKKAQKVILPGLEGLSLYDLLEIYIFGIIQGTFSTRASSIAFSFFMAIFPFLLFILNLIPFVWFIDDFQLKLLAFIDTLLPPQTAFFSDVFADIASTPRGGLLSFAFLLSIFLTSNGINAIFTGFEFSYHTTINRTIIRQYFVAMGVAIIVAVLMLISVIVFVYLTYIIEDLEAIGVFTDNIIWAQIGRYLVFILMVYSITATLYFFGTKEGRNSKFFSIGALFTTLLILLTTFLFAIYIEKFSAYNELYGSIGALLILMLYIWLNSNILLLGFELNATINRLKKKK
ncbi:YihY/virulence factor BrkB family protein [Haloflavibacter putidus]|uniref:YihY/virulence factor BrkB family protein n=1 Tax=Haloflavibacter putidus TaxID=2576776 RepID=A0A507ZTP2_9FLAO|nr:YihY/virulence factor BrkB family protein [Haloflavibacter putidus]TQD39108.1 YihY/virulence factor BrkB family protein [Haloflavibacter putidus]